MTCSKCRYKFALDPKKEGFTDNQFVRALRQASQQDQQYFTFHQFFAALYQQAKLTQWWIANLAGAVLVGGLSYAIFENIALSLFLALASVGIAIFKRGGNLSTAPDPVKIQVLFDRWLRHRGEPLEKYLRTPRLLAAPTATSEPDIYDYGVEGILLLDQDIYVDLLVLNDLHSEFRLLILSQGGYPAYLFDKANELLASRSDLPVYLLHDGATVAKNITHKFTLAGNPVFDLGLQGKDFSTVRHLQPFQQVTNFPLDLCLTSQLRRLLAIATRKVQEVAADGGTYVDSSGDNMVGGILVLSLFGEAMGDGDGDSGGDDFG